MKRNTLFLLCAVTATVLTSSAAFASGSFKIKAPKATYSCQTNSSHHVKHKTDICKQFKNFTGGEGFIDFKISRTGKSHHTYGQTVTVTMKKANATKCTFNFSVNAVKSIISDDNFILLNSVNPSDSCNFSTDYHKTITLSYTGSKNS